MKQLINAHNAPTRALRLSSSIEKNHVFSCCRGKGTDDSEITLVCNEKESKREN